MNSIYCPIYTKNNWNLVNCLFGGPFSGTKLTVFLDSPAHLAKLAKLKRINPYLVLIIDQYTEANGIVFIREFK